jgi:hypothetical protein
MRAARASDVEQQLLGVWKLESMYQELNITGEKKHIFGEKPNGYIIGTPEKRMNGPAYGRGVKATDHRRGPHCCLHVGGRIQWHLPR